MGKKNKKFARVSVSGKNPELFNKLFNKLIKSIEEYFDIHEKFSNGEFNYNESDISSLKNLGEESFKNSTIEDEKVKAEIISTYANIEFKKISILRENEKAKIDNLKKIKEEQLNDIKTKCSLIKVLIDSNQVFVTKDIRSFIENIQYILSSNSSSAL